jgi:hypothetical protein
MLTAYTHIRRHEYNNMYRLHDKPFTEYLSIFMMSESTKETFFFHISIWVSEFTKGEESTLITEELGKKIQFLAS